MLEAQLLEEGRTEVTYILPTSRGQRTYFASLFEELESRKTELHVASYGVSDTTLDEVFVKVTRAATKGKSIEPSEMRERVVRRNAFDSDMSDNEGNDVINGNGFNPEAGWRDGPRASGAYAFFLKMYALFFKHFLHNTFNWRSYLSFLLLPNALIVLAMVFMQFKPRTISEPKIQLAPELYDQTHSFMRYVS